jgi:hypothetical protein
MAEATADGCGVCCTPAVPEVRAFAITVLRRKIGHPHLAEAGRNVVPREQLHFVPAQQDVIRASTTSSPTC